MRHFRIDSSLSRSRVLVASVTGLILSLALVACQNNSSSSNPQAGAAVPMATTGINQAKVPPNSTLRAPAPHGTFAPGDTLPPGPMVNSTPGPVNGTGGPPGPRNPGFGPGGPGAMGWMGSNIFDTAAKALNLDTQDLIAQIQSGKSLTDIAKEKGVDETTLKDALLNAAKAGIDEAVSSGRLAQQEGDQIKSQLDQMDLNGFLQQPRGPNGGFGPGEPPQGQQQPPMTPASPSN